MTQVRVKEAPQEYKDQEMTLLMNKLQVHVFNWISIHSHVIFCAQEMRCTWFNRSGECLIVIQGTQYEETEREREANDEKNERQQDNYLTS